MVRAAVIIGAIALAGVAWRLAPQAEKARVVPPPSVDAAAGEATSEVAVLAGGCFWGVQGVFQHVKGVTGAVSGYAVAGLVELSPRWTRNGQIGGLADLSSR